MSSILICTDVVAEVGVKHSKAVLYGLCSERLLFGGSYEADRWVDEAGIFLSGRMTGCKFTCCDLKCCEKRTAGARLNCAVHI